MKKQAYLFLVIAVAFNACLTPKVQTSVQTTQTLPEFTTPPSETEAHLRFIASDELQGRKTGEPGNMVAARYIAEQFRKLGIKPAHGETSYYQPITFSETKKSPNSLLIIGTDTLKAGIDLIASGSGIDLKNTPYIYANYGWADSTGYDDYKNLDVQGKVVVVSLGTPIANPSIRAQIRAGVQKDKIAKAHGALALIEIYTAKIPWENILNFLGKGSLTLKDTSEKVASNFPHVLINGSYKDKFTKGNTTKLSLQTYPQTERLVMSPNVVGVMEGSDPLLKDQYIILSAHFDHLGVIPRDPKDALDADTIYNGARDNAFGVTAMLYAAHSLTQLKPKRSVVFIGFTGEEIGLLGSEYYAKHPLIPLKQCVFAFDTDGAGYNDTTLVTIIGLNRTDCNTEINQAANAFGLKTIDDPVPEQGLFDRSDNVSFAREGIPSPDFAPGFTKFDDEILKYYHNLADNPETVNFRYFHRYCQVYAHAARLIANREKQPAWKAGDKYEKAYKALYGR